MRNYSVEYVICVMGHRFVECQRTLDFMAVDFDANGGDGGQGCRKWRTGASCL